MSLSASAKSTLRTPQGTASGAKKTIKTAERHQSTELVTPPRRKSPVNAGVQLNA